MTVRRSLFACLSIVLASCAGGPPPAPAAPSSAHGVISLEVIPNPIVATLVSGNTYDFSFDAVIRESGGHAVSIDRVSAEVYALGALRLASESYDAARLNGLGFETKVGPRGEMRYHFSQRKSVGDARLFGGVTANLRVDATDDTGTAIHAETKVSVRQQ